MSHSAPPPASQLVPDVGRVVVEVREPALDRAQPADPAGGDDVADGDPRRVEPVHERLHQPDALRRAGLDDAFRIGRGQGQRLLAQDVLAGPGRGDRPLARAGDSAAGCRPRPRRGRRAAPRTTRARWRCPARRRPSGPGPRRASRWPRPRSEPPSGARGSPSCDRCRPWTGSPSAGRSSLDHSHQVSVRSSASSCSRAEWIRRFHLTPDGRVVQICHRFGREEHKSGDDRSRRARPAQRDGPPGEPERDRRERSTSAVPCRARTSSPRPD